MQNSAISNKVKLRMVPSNIDSFGIILFNLERKNCMDINEKKVILIYEDETIIEWARWLSLENRYEQHNEILCRISNNVPNLHKAVIIFEFKRNSECTIFVPKATHDYQKGSLGMLMPYEEKMRYRVYLEKEDGTYEEIDNEDQKANYDEMLSKIDERMVRNRG